MIAPINYRDYAEETRKLAAVLSNPKDKTALELMATAWERIAAEQESQLKK